MSIFSIFSFFYLQKNHTSKSRLALRIVENTRIDRFECLLFTVMLTEQSIFVVQLHTERLNIYFNRDHLKTIYTFHFIHHRQITLRKKFYHLPRST